MKCRILVKPESLISGERPATTDEFHYLVRVRRLKQGDKFVAFDGQGRESVATINSIRSDTAVFQFEPPEEKRSADKPFFHILLPLIKGERIEACISQLVELGVDRITLFEAERAVVVLDHERAKKRVDRFRRITIAAAKQCRRSDIPVIDELTSLHNALSLCAENSTKIACWTDAITPLSEAVPDKTPVGYSLISGPEGGFSPEEINAIKDQSFIPVTLGARILRAETAPAAVLSALTILGGAPR